MQTFLPYRDFRKSFKCLDYKRLGKQRVEAQQILNAITGRTNWNGWRNHPCTKMWRDYPEALAFYKDLCIDEWEYRGYVNNMSFSDETTLFSDSVFPDNKLPWWLGNAKFHKSHRAALLFKNIEFYSQFGWKEEPKLEYFWPV